MRYAASLGVTTHLDEGAFPAAGYDVDGAAHADEYHAYDALLALFHEGRLINRYRLDFLTMEADVNTPHLKARLAERVPEVRRRHAEDRRHRRVHRGRQRDHRRRDARVGERHAARRAKPAGATRTTR